MKNKFKIAAIVVTVIVGMVLYKSRFEKKQEEENEPKPKAKASSRRDYLN